MSAKKQNWTTWFEIPVSDFKRAQEFYEAIFETELEVLDFGNLQMGVFPHRETGAALCRNEFYIPGDQGPLVYLNANPDLQKVQDRIKKAGGDILIGKRQISPEHGFMCVFRDTEGNRLALHSDE